MADQQWEQRSDRELVDEAQTGLRGQGAVVEMMRRLKEALLKEERAIKLLTIVLVFFTLVQTVLLILEFRR